MTDLGSPMDGLAVVLREDGRLAVRLALLARSEEVARYDELGREKAWFDAQPEGGGVPEPLQAAIESGAMPFREALPLAYKHTELKLERSQGILGFLEQVRALHDAYPECRTAGEALERAWWDGRFDAADDPPTAVGDELIADVIRAVVRIGHRLAGGDVERGPAMLKERVEGAGGPEGTAIRVVFERAIRQREDGAR